LFPYTTLFRSQVARIEAEDRTPVGGDVADATEPRADAVNGMEVGRVDQVVDFPGAVGLLVDGGDFDREHETHRRPAGGGQRARDLLLDLISEPKQARLGRNEFCLE